jgi:DNA-binding transcriptional LysR family regulator
VQLFDRQVRPLALTPRGSVLLEKARALLLAARETVQATRSPAAPTFSKVSLWLIDSLAATIGSELFRNIRDLAGAWYVQQGSHAVHAQALLSRAADVILTSDPMEDEPHLERHKIIKEPFVLALPERLAHCRDKLSELAATCDFVRFGSRTLISRQIDRYLRRRRIDVRGQIEFDSCEAVLAAVAAGYGWAIVTPLAALAGKSHWPRVDFAPLPEPIGHRRIFVVARQGELGPLPQVIAEVAAQCIATRFEEDFVDERLWMSEGCALKFRDGI